MKFLTYILLFVALSSCGRSVLRNKTTNTINKDSTTTSVDTTKKSVVNQETETTYYGDTLTGNIYLPTEIDTIDESQYMPNDTVEHIIRIHPKNSVYVDSLESNGIKIRVGIIPIKGGFKAHINAISKPKETVKTTNTNATEQRGIGQTTNNKTEETHTASAKEIKNNRFPWWIIIVLIGVLGGGYIIYKKYF